MIVWKEEKTESEDVVHNLFLSHHYQEEKLVATLFKGNETNDWLYTSELTNSCFEFLMDGKFCEHDAKLCIQEIIYNHFEDERNYYQEILDELELEEV